MWEDVDVHVHVPGADNYTESWQDDQDSNYHYKSGQIQRPQMDTLDFCHIMDDGRSSQSRSLSKIF